MEQNGRKVLEEKISHSKMKTVLASLPQIYPEAEDSEFILMRTPRRDNLDIGRMMLMYIFRVRGATDVSTGVRILAYLNYCKEVRGSRLHLTESYNISVDIDEYIEILHRLFVVLQQNVTNIFSFEFATSLSLR